MLSLKTLLPKRLLCTLLTIYCTLIYAQPQEEECPLFDDHCALEAYQSGYSRYRSWAYGQIDPLLDECAKFVNRMLLVRFDIPVYGEAWTMQLHPDNQRYLDLLWRIPEGDFTAEDDFRLQHYSLRVEHFKQLYQTLQSQRNPIGVLGWLYHYSHHKDKLVDNALNLPQTHVSFLAGVKVFTFTNDTKTTQSLESLLITKYGKIHVFERSFIASHLDLDRMLKPGETYYYQDYYIEDQFKTLRDTSLIAVFLEKHWYNRKTPLLRPVSYSQVIK